jgi:hypothetical protein
VSRYLSLRPEERHVRFSVWRDRDDRSQAEAAASLEHAEARRLADFLLGTEPAPGRPASIVRALRDFVSR